MSEHSHREVFSFCVGYRHPGEGERLSAYLSDYPEVGEVYFPWVGEPSGRPILGHGEEADPDALAETLRDELTALKARGIWLDLLLNANCYGSQAISAALESHVISVLATLVAWGVKPDVVTTASPFVARTVKRVFPEIEVRASVNMRLTSLHAIATLAPWFDSYYLGRDVQRDLSTVSRVSAWCRAHGKKLGILANSGCLANCPWQTFHDNLIAHSAAAECRPAAKDFNPHLCWTLYRDPKNFPEILRATWIRPEDLDRYAGLVDFVKLATRQHSRPRLVIDAYARRSFHGNLLELFEPGFAPAFVPAFVNNDAFPDDWFDHTSACGRTCENCTYCADVFRRVSGEAPAERTNAAATSRDLGGLRAQIDALDHEIARLIAHRVRLADDIAAVKRAHHAHVADPARERQVIDAVSSIAGPDAAEDVRTIYATMMDVSKARQRRRMVLSSSTQKGNNPK